MSCLFTRSLSIDSVDANNNHNINNNPEMIMPSSSSSSSSASTSKATLPLFSTLSSVPPPAMMISSGGSSKVGHWNCFSFLWNDDYFNNSNSNNKQSFKRRGRKNKSTIAASRQKKSYKAVPRDSCPLLRHVWNQNWQNVIHLCMDDDVNQAYMVTQNSYRTALHLACLLSSSQSQKSTLHMDAIGFLLFTNPQALCCLDSIGYTPIHVLCSLQPTQYRHSILVSCCDTLIRLSLKSCIPLKQKKRNNSDIFLDHDVYVKTPLELALDRQAPIPTIQLLLQTMQKQISWIGPNSIGTESYHDYSSTRSNKNNNNNKYVSITNHFYSSPLHQIIYNHQPTLSLLSNNSNHSVASHGSTTSGASAANNSNNNNHRNIPQVTIPLLLQFIQQFKNNASQPNLRNQSMPNNNDNQQSQSSQRSSSSSTTTTTATTTNIDNPNFSFNDLMNLKKLLRVTANHVISTTKVKLRQQLQPSTNFASNEQVMNELKATMPKQFQHIITTWEYCMALLASYCCHACNQDASCDNNNNNNNDDDDSVVHDEYFVLHAICSFVVPTPILVELALWVYPHQVHLQDIQYQMTPLQHAIEAYHHGAATSSSSSYYFSAATTSYRNLFHSVISHVVSALLELHTTTTNNSEYSLLLPLVPTTQQSVLIRVLTIALSGCLKITTTTITTNSKTLYYYDDWLIDELVPKLLILYPNAIHQKDPLTKLYPFALAATFPNCPLQLIYQLLCRDPQAVAESIINA